MLVKLILFELRLQSRQNLFRFGCLAFFLLGLFGTAGSFEAGVFKDSPFTVSRITGIFSLGTVIAIAMFSGIAILRDRESKMEGILFSTNLTHAQYVLSRFVGLVLAALMCFALTMVGLYMAHFVPWVEANQVGSYSVGPYLWSFLVIGVPNILVGSAVIFATGVLTRSNMATYLSGILLYVVYWAGAMIGKSPLLAANASTKSETPGLAALLDPYALTALITQTRYWSVARKNADYPELIEFFLYNRLLWVGLSLTLFALTYRFFQFREVVDSGKKKKRMAPLDIGPLRPYRAVKPAYLGFLSNLRIAFSETRMIFKTVIKGVPFYGLLLLWGLLITIAVVETLRSTMVGLPHLPWTGFILPGILEVFGPLGTLVVIFYAFEILHIERSHGFDGIQHATPGRNYTLLLSKFAALAGFIAVLILFSIIIAVIVQATKPGASFNLFLYGSLFYRVGIPLLAVGAGCLMIGSLISNKYAGMGLSFLYFVPFSAMVLPRTLLLEHPMLRFGYTPEFVYSPMVGMAYYDDALWPFLVFWSGLSGLLLLVALRFWPRGPERRQHRIELEGKVFGGVGTALLLSSGAYLFFKLHVDNDYQSKAHRYDLMAEYETKYLEFEHLEGPVTTEVDLIVELLPEDRSYKMKGNLTFENRTDEVLDRILVGISSQVQDVRYMLLEARQDHDAEFGMTWFSFDKPMQPGELRQLGFELSIQRDAFKRLDAENYVLPNYSYLEFDKMLPFFGLNSKYVLTKTREREKRGLPPRDSMPKEDAHAHEMGQLVNYRVIASTSPEQTIVIPGRLVREWSEKGRSFAEVVSDGPKPLRLALASGQWEIETMKVQDIELTAYTARGHEVNLKSMMHGVRDTVEYGQRHFSPYENDSLRLVEIPSFSDRFGATAYHNATFGVENRLYLIDQPEHRMDMAYRTLAHEMGHYWWGYQLVPAFSEGAHFLTEFLAVYTETVVYDQHHAKKDRWEYLDLTEDYYFYFRGHEPEVEMPLARVQFQPYVYYFKGAQVAHAVRELVGEIEVNRVLSGFLEEFGSPKLARAKELVPRLVAAAPDRHREAVKELLTEVVTHHISLERLVRSDKDPNQLVLELNCEATLLKEDGTEVHSPMQEIEVGLYQDDQLIEIKSLELDRGKGTYQVEAQQSINQVTLDPQRLKIEANRGDNSKRIKAGTSMQ